MKIILFVGHHKVGSSALQRHLARNAVALLRRGVLYPAVEAQGLATLLAMALAAQTGRDGGGIGGELPVNLREAHNALAFAMLAEGRDGGAVPDLHQKLPPARDMLVAIQRQIEVFAPHTVILAAEVFANFAHHPELIAALVAALKDAAPGAGFTLTATLRRIDDYLVSWHGQRLRFGQTVRALPQGALDHYVGGIHFDYRRMLEPWIAALPEADLVLRPYDKVLEAGGSVADFLNWTGIAGDTGLPAPDIGERVNAGLHRGVIELARRANGVLPPPAARATLAALLRLGSGLGLPPSAEIEMFGAGARAHMAACFAPVHDWLGERTGAPFFADADRIGQLCPHPEIAANRTALAALQAQADDLPEAARSLFDTLDLVPNFT